MTLLKENTDQVRSRSKLGSVAFLGGVAVGATVLLAVTALAFGANRELPNTAMFTFDGDGTVSLIDTSSGEWIYQAADAVLAPDRTVLIQATEQSGETVVRALDSVSAVERWSQSLPGTLSVRVVSPGGEAIALMQAPESEGLYVSEPREDTTIYVARTDGSPWERYDLEGNFLPEAFTTSGETLFLLKFLPAEDPYYYEVHRLDLATGEMLDEYTPEVELEPSMRGHARAQAMALDGTQLFTLYSLDPGEEKITNPLDPNRQHSAFVHVISLEEESSFCIFLGQPFGSRQIDNMDMTISPDGTSLALIDMGTGTLAEIDTATQNVDMVNLGSYGFFGEHHRKVELALGADDTLYLAWEQIVTAYAPDARNPIAGWSAGGEILGIDVSQDGQYLRALIPGQVRVIDLAQGVEVASILLPAEAQEVVIAPPSAQSRFESFTCAC